jgi:hypothetical protein
MYGYATAKTILRDGYFWPSLFKDCITVIHKCHACQTYNNKIRSHPAPLHPVVSIGPFDKWGIEFMTCNPHLTGGMDTLLYLWIISLSGLRRCLHLIIPGKLQRYSYSIISLLDLVSLNPSSLITVVIFTTS